MNKYSINNYYVMYLIGYIFFFEQIFCQILLSIYGIKSFIPIILSSLLLPLFIYLSLTIKNINSNSKISLIIKLLTIIYFSIQTIITLNYASNMIHNYYYQTTPTFIITLFLLIPIIYILYKQSNIYYSLSFIFFIILFILKTLYISNHSNFDLYPLSNIFNSNSFINILFLTIPLFLEPLVLITNTKMIDNNIKPNKKLILSLSFLTVSLTIYTILRESMEFGLLLDKINFPYYESCKYLFISSSLDNIDFIYLFSITIALFSRIPLFFFLIKDNFKTSNIINLSIIILFILITFFLNKQDLFNTILIPLFVSMSVLLIIISFIILLKKLRRIKYEK